MRGLFLVLAPPTTSMSTSDVTAFCCPNCAASYKLVHVEAEPTASEPELACLRCDGALPSHEGSCIRKYLLVDHR